MYYRAFNRRVSGGHDLHTSSTKPRNLYYTYLKISSTKSFIVMAYMTHGRMVSTLFYLAKWVRRDVAAGRG